MDNVPCIVSPFWPSSASDFVNRTRKHDWPSKECIQQITESGCHVVGKSHPESKQEEKSIEFRWSFSIAERELLHRMSNTMIACMYIIKAIKKKFWVKNEDESSGFCSYFLKTACLWVHEEEPVNEDNLINLSRKILDWLISCYDNRVLPHYFIPEQNLSGHLSGETIQLEDARKWLIDRKANLIQDLLLSIRLDHGHEMIQIIRSRLGLTAKGDLNQLLLALRENEGAKEVLEEASRQLARSGECYQTNQRHKFARLLSHHYPPINSTLNRMCINELKGFDRTLSSRNVGDLRNEQVTESVRRLKSNVHVPDNPLDLKFVSIHKHVLNVLDEFANEFSTIAIEQDLWVPDGFRSVAQNLLYRLLGEGYHMVYFKLPTVLEEAKVVYADGSLTDKRLGDLVLLAKHYYLGERWDKLQGVLSELEPLLEEEFYSSSVAVMAIAFPLITGSAPGRQSGIQELSCITLCR